MPHVIVEYSENVEPEAGIPALLRLIADRCANTDNVLPVAGIRVRAVRLTEYVIADGKPEYGLVNVTVKMGAGRPQEFKKTFFGSLFEAIKSHLSNAFKARPVALSMYVEEIDEQGAYRHNGVRDAMGLPPKQSAT